MLEKKERENLLNKASLEELEELVEQKRKQLQDEETKPLDILVIARTSLGAKN